MVKSLESQNLILLIKTADQTITSDSTLTIDADLQFEALASKTYIIEITLVVNSAAAADFAYLLQIPNLAVALRNDAAFAPESAVATQDAETTSGLIATDASDQMIHLEIRVVMGTTAGTVGIQWAQAVSNAGNTILRQGSSMRVFRMD